MYKENSLMTLRKIIFQLFKRGMFKLTVRNINLQFTKAISAYIHS